MFHVSLSSMMARKRQAARAAAAEAGASVQAAGHGSSIALWASHLARRVVHTPLGPVLLAASDTGLAGLWFQGQRHDPQAAWRGLGHQPEQASHPVLREAEDQLHEYFDRRRHFFSVPLDLSHGTPFQRQVWQALCGIPAGRTVGYAALAAQVGSPAAARAVGAAVGRNPVSIIVPCHRVLGTGGALTGYAGGLARKQALLQLEGALA